ncbi:unnamed protein product, partial [Meganyctiphanes norvegica]
MESMYRNLSEVVPPTSVDQGMMTPTRLQAVNGKLPYLPCRVQFYGAKQLRHCLLQRTSNTKNDIIADEHQRSDLNTRNIIPTWLAFVGDSKMRDKFHAIVFGLRAELKWSRSWDPHNNGSYIPVSLEELDKSIAAHLMVSMRAVSTDGLLQIDFVWSSRGLVTDTYKEGSRPVPLLKHWATTSKDMPHLIVMGIGLWTFLHAFESNQNYLAPYDSILQTWMQTIDVLNSLATQTNILVWPQNRKRDYAAFDYIKNKHFTKRDILLNHMISNQALEWIEMAMHASLQNITGVTLWDSLLPFNLANIRECEAIREVIFEGYGEDDSTVSNKKITSPSMNINMYSYDDKTNGKIKNTENIIAPVEYLRNKSTSEREDKKKMIPTKELQINRIGINDKKGDKENRIETIEYLGRRS